MIEHHFTLNDHDLGVLVAGAKKLPWEICQPLLEKLQAQLSSQVAPKPVLKVSRKRKMNGRIAPPAE